MKPCRSRFVSDAPVSVRARLIPQLGQLGALLELSEKTVIIGEIGKLIVDELPTERTPPGGMRAPYRGVFSACRDRKSVV